MLSSYHSDGVASHFNSSRSKSHMLATARISKASQINDYGLMPLLSIGAQKGPRLNESSHREEMNFLRSIMNKSNKQAHSDEPDLVRMTPKQEYDYYDMIVRDLLTEIQLRKSRIADQDTQPLRICTMKAIVSKGKKPEKTCDSGSGGMKGQKSQSYISLDSRNTEKMKGMSLLRQRKTGMVFRLQDFSADKIYERKISSYIQFLFKINYSNDISADLSLSNPGKLYKVKVGPGNNSRLVKTILKRRFWLQFVSNPNQAVFLWTQNTDHSFHSRQQSLKSEIGHSSKFQEFLSPPSESLKQKGLLPLGRCKSKAHFSDQNGSQQLMINQPAELLSTYQSTPLPPTNDGVNYVDPIDGSVYFPDIQNKPLPNSEDSQKDIIEVHRFQKGATSQKVLPKLKLSLQGGKETILGSKYLSRKSGSTPFEKIMPKQEALRSQKAYLSYCHGQQKPTLPTKEIHITNHLPENFIIGSKRMLYELLSWWCNVTKVKLSDLIPTTYSIRSVSDPVFKEFIQTNGHDVNRLWIVKPGELTNRGTGIKVAQTSDVQHCLIKEKHRNGQDKTYIVQEYINPLLYNGRKFDIRHYLLLTSNNGFLKAYWYQEGYIRTTSSLFDPYCLSDSFIHLTNDAIQKNGPNYGKYQPGNKLSYSAFQRYLDSTYPQKKIDFTQILEKMKEITKQVVLAAASAIDKSRKSHNFQLFGLDFMLDRNLKVYLIQINANPCLEVSCPVLESVIPGMLENVFRIGLDPLIPPPQHYPPNARYKLSDRFIDSLKFDLLFDQKTELPLQAFEYQGPVLHHEDRFEDEPSIQP